MQPTLRLITTDEPIPPTPGLARAEQLWRAAWLCTAGRIEFEGPPLLPDAVAEQDVFASYVAQLRHRLGDRQTPAVKAVVAAACWYGLGLPAPPTLPPLFGGHVTAWRQEGLGDDDIVRRLAGLLRPPW